jgi:2-dehydro-3-deoxyphosphooctonate aldolase (KDO 8-P synthase)
MYSKSSNQEVLGHLLPSGNLDSSNFFLIAGPCVVESQMLCEEIAGRISEITEKLKIPYIFKASYRKANRSKSDSYSGPGDDQGLEVLSHIRQSFHLPVTTDIHSAPEAAMAAEVADVLQIPAFLCRQTDLLLAAGATGKTVNIKKGQFLSPEAMVHAVRKVRSTGNNSVWSTERGTTFGYQDLVVDFRGIPAMQEFSPVVMDVTHSLQQPNQASGVTGGRPDLIETIARAAIAVGANGLFIETHPDPSVALSDGANMLKLDFLEPLLERLIRIKEAIRP